MYTVIESTDNKRIKKVMKLIKSSSYRREQQLFVIEGKRLCGDALLSGVDIREVYFSEEYAAKNPDDAEALTQNAEGFLLSDKAMKKLSDTVSNQGVLAVCGFISRAGDDIKPGGRYIAGENIQDPANIGAIARSAEALGCDGIIFSSDSCDIYNPKVLRASMGAIFRLPVFIPQDMNSFLVEAQSAGFKIFASVPDRTACDISDAGFCDGSIAFVGNEGRGLSSNVLTIADQVFTIKMKGRAESLNAAAAAAIIIYELMNQDFCEERL